MSWHDCLCELTDSYVWHYLTWLINMREMTYSFLVHYLFVCVTCLIHMCVMTHSCRRESFRSVTWLIHFGDMTNTYPQHESHKKTCIHRRVTKKKENHPDNEDGAPVVRPWPFYLVTLIIIKNHPNITITSMTTIRDRERERERKMEGRSERARERDTDKAILSECVCV